MRWKREMKPTADEDGDVLNKKYIYFSECLRVAVQGMILVSNISKAR